MSQKLFIQRPSENFTQIPNELINDNRFNNYSKYGLYAKLLIISLYQNDARSWTPTRKLEAEKLGVSYATFNNRVLPVAKELGWLSITQENSRGRNATWSITIPKACQDVSYGETPGVSPGETQYNTNIYNTNTAENFRKEDFDIRSAILSETPTRAITLARKALREETLELSEVIKLLSTHVSNRHSHLSKTPMFAIRLEAYKNDEEHVKEHVKLANLWIAIREDLTGVHQSSDSKEFTKIIGITKNLLKKYPYSQIYWTMVKIVSSNVEDMKFMVNGPQTVEFLIKKYASSYRAIRESDLRSRDSRDRILIAKVKEEEEEKNRLEENLKSEDSESGRLLRLLKWDD
jgi:hypothetical protein